MSIRAGIPFELLKIPQTVEFFQFGPVKIFNSQVFAKSKLSYAFVNIKPFAPGHSLVSPLRVVNRYKDLTPEEIYDWSCLVQVVAESLEKMYKGTSCSIIVQDGPEAGQTIPHLHAHIIPRKKDDMEDPDSIYEKVDNNEGTLKTAEEMAELATETKKYIELVANSKAVGCMKEEK
ncbi:bis-(5'-nucleosyl)-[tri-or tetra-] phosphatase [Theileria orientalis]|uniref:Bis(5'-adenosyl)-triphosphatase n=1 Tax=Theileria orientalis TaxID=68886 RepID=A0A976M6W7_THEOR|nr:bis-(5'-nucleosyl)-[tri-or tetra-] phosphatase [Theileria orientalis]